jgi:hypothetical protein
MSSFITVATSGAVAFITMELFGIPCVMEMETGAAIASSKVINALAGPPGADVMVAAACKTTRFSGVDGA